MIDPLPRQPPAPMKFEKGDTVILCEGRDECAVLHELCADWSRKPKIGVCADEINLAAEILSLVTLARTHRIATIGLVFDAEKKPAESARKIRKKLNSAGLNAPTRAIELAATKLNDDLSLNTAYLINPHMGGPGAVESYFIPQIMQSKSWKCIEALLSCYDKIEPSKQQKDKLIVRTFIAHSNASNTGLNSAFNAKILDCNHPILDPVRQFLKLLKPESPIESPHQVTKLTG